MTEERQWPGSPFTDEEIRERIASAANEGAEVFRMRGDYSKDNFFYLSFVDNEKPKGEQWMGGCYIRADTRNEAIVLSHRLGINPGGETMISGPRDSTALIEGYEHRILTREEIDSGVDSSKLKY